MHLWGTRRGVGKRPPLNPDFGKNLSASDPSAPKYGIDWSMSLKIFDALTRGTHAKKEESARRTQKNMRGAVSTATAAAESEKDTRARIPMIRSICLIFRARNARKPHGSRFFG